MKALRTPPLNIDLPPGVISYREFREHTSPDAHEILKHRHVLSEPPARYGRRKPDATAKVRTQKVTPHPFNKDLRWKMIIESLPREFLRFFAPGIAAVMDPAQKIVFLDKELLELLPEDGKRLEPVRVDKLVKVPVLDGSNVMLHCEVQGSPDEAFPARMHRYYTCLESKYPGQVTAIAILTDGNKDFRPAPFREIRGAKKIHRLCYDYAVYKVLDQPEDELEQSDNPFALVLLTVKAALKWKKGQYTEEEYFRRKLELVEWLKKKPTTIHQEKNLLSFLKEYVPLKDQALETKFNKQLKERNKVMDLVESLINEAKEQGIEQGRAEGIEQGIEQGRAEGIEQGIEHEKRSFARTLINSTDFNDQKIAALAGMEEKTVIGIRAELQSDR